MLEQWHEHLLKVGVSPTEIGTYDGDSKNKHGVLRAEKGADNEGEHLLPPRFTLLVNDTLMRDAREMMKSFHENDAGETCIKPSPLIPDITPHAAFRLLEKYMAAKAKKPDRLTFSDKFKGKSNEKTVTEIIDAEVKERPQRPHRKCAAVAAFCASPAYSPV